MDLDTRFLLIAGCLWVMAQQVYAAVGWACPILVQRAAPSCPQCGKPPVFKSGQTVGCVDGHWWTR